MIEVLTTGALATVQDLGREGALRWGVGTSGAMDAMALAAGNLLVGNDEAAAGIEWPTFPVQVRFETDVQFAITGADTAARLDEQPVLPWWRHLARAGQVLRLQSPRRAAWSASRAYLCVAGGIDVPRVLGSRSTQMRGAFGGFEGRTLRLGDRLPLGQPALSAAEVSPADCGLMPPALAMPLQRDGCPAVRVLPAAEYDAYTEDARAALWGSPWKITAQSDRYGFRLAGPALLPVAPMEMRSHGIVPGVIQVPPGGQPIVQMRDAQPSGGYPKIGTVIEADLWRLGQAPIGSSVRFLPVTWAEAVDALSANRHWLADARRRLTLWQRSSAATMVQVSA